MRQPDLTPSVVELTFNHSQRIILSYMIFKVLSLRKSSTGIWALYSVTTTHRPVLENHKLVCRFVLLAVFTTEGMLVTELILMVMEFPSPKETGAIITLNFSKLAIIKLAVIAWIHV